MKTSKKFNAESIIVLCVFAVASVVMVVGICVPWLNEFKDGYLAGTFTINYYFIKGLTETKGFTTMFGLALASVLSCAIITVSYTVSRFVNTEKFTALWCVCILVSLALLLCSAFTIYFTQAHISAVYVFEDKTHVFTLGAGVWIFSLFGIIAGASGLAAFSRLAFKSWEKD